MLQHIFKTTCFLLTICVLSGYYFMNYKRLILTAVLFYLYSLYSFAQIKTSAQLYPGLFDDMQMHSYYGAEELSTERPG